MKNLKGRGVFALAAMMSMFAVHPGDALAKGTALITYSGSGSDLNATVELTTSQSESGIANLNGGSSTSMTVTFNSGQSGHTGKLIKPNGTLHCTTGTVFSTTTVSCAAGHAFFELVVD